MITESYVSNPCPGCGATVECGDGCPVVRKAMAFRASPYEHDLTSEPCVAASSPTDPSRVDEQRVDIQVADVRAALRILDEENVPGIDYYTGIELTIAQRVKILASWAGRGRRKR